MVPPLGTVVAGVKTMVGVTVAPAVVLPTLIEANAIPVIAAASRPIEMTSPIALDFI